MKVYGVIGAIGLGVSAMGCSGDAAPASTVATQGGGGMGGQAGAGLMLAAGNGGAVGSAGNANAGGTAGAPSTAGGSNGGAGGAAMPQLKPPKITLHSCPAQPDPACPAKVVTGHMQPQNLSDWSSLQGVTAIEGDLTLLDLAGADALNCLESISGRLEIDQNGLGDDFSLWGLRNLKTIGLNIDASADSDRVFADCGLRHLESVDYIDGRGDLAGDWDLSGLKTVLHVRFRNTQLWHVTLPSSEMLTMGQLLFETDPYLTQVSGFAGVTIRAMSVGGTYSVRIVDNPFLSNCRAQELAKLFLDGGAQPTGVMISGNLPCP